MTPNAAPAVESPVVRKGFVTVDGRLVHFRRAGRGPTLVMLHDSPRSSRLHLDTMRRLATDFQVYSLDTPGYGQSAPLPIERPTIADFADALGRTLEVMGLTAAVLYGTHTSAKIALDYAARIGSPPRLLLDGLAIPTAAPDPAFIAAYMRPFELDDAGAYLAREWTRTRDMLRWFPWFRQTPGTRMAIPAQDDAWVADYVIDLMSAGPHYASAYSAAMYFDPMPALRAVTCPTIVAARADDVLHASLDRVPVDENDALRVMRLPADRDAWLDWLGTMARGAPALPERGFGSDTATYVDLAHGQMLVHRSGDSSRTPLLILDAPTAMHARLWQTRFADRPTLVPELPGCGDSDALPTPSIAAFVEVLAAMLQTLGHARVDLLALGYATPIAATFAARYPEMAHRVVLDGCFGFRDEDRSAIAAALCPDIGFDPGGGHFHRIWHMLRDGEAQWPWFDGAPAAHRTLSPTLAAAALHPALVGILKQPVSYGDAARAAVMLSNQARYPNFDRPALIFERAGDAGYDEAAALAARLPDASLVRRDADIDAAAARVRDFLAGRSAAAPRDMPARAAAA